MASVMSSLNCFLDIFFGISFVCVCFLPGDAVFLGVLPTMDVATLIVPSPSEVSKLEKRRGAGLPVDKIPRISMIILSIELYVRPLSRIKIYKIAFLKIGWIRPR